MISENYKTKPKKFYFKAFQHLSQLENTLKCIKEEGSSNFQISILVRINQLYVGKDIEKSNAVCALKKYWKNQFGNTINFGSFYNPQIGTIFIVGSLASTFLHKINGKPLAALSSGSYGIFRGIGASETQANTYLNLLSSGSYVLIVRGFEDEFQNLNNMLNN